MLCIGIIDINVVLLIGGQKMAMLFDVSMSVCVSASLNCTRGWAKSAILNLNCLDHTASKTMTGNMIIGYRTSLRLCR